MNNEQIYNMLRAGKFKGHTRITLENVKNGHRTIVEDHNMATNALPKIFESDYNGTMDFYSLMPLKNLLGGVLLFWNPLTESADNIFPPSQNTNKLTAHAGQTANTNADPTRGAPNALATVEDQANGSIKFVWDWTLEEGNGQISAAALTHKDIGDAGLYPDGTLPLAFNYGLQLDSVNRFDTAYRYWTFNEAFSYRCPLDIKANGAGVSVFIDGTTFKENTVRHPWVKPTLLEGIVIDNADNYVCIGTRTATLSRTFTSEYTQIAEDSDNYYVMERDSGNARKLYLDIVSKTDMTVTSEAITITENLARFQAVGAVLYSGIVSDGFIYWVSADDAKTFVRIDIATPANTDVLSSTLTGSIDLRSRPVVLNDELVLGYNFFINGNYVYPVAVRTMGTQNVVSCEVLSDFQRSPLMHTMPGINTHNFGEYVKSNGVLVPYMATCNSLENSVVKSNSETMRVEYTVTFTEGV